MEYMELSIRGIGEVTFRIFPKKEIMGRKYTDISFISNGNTEVILPFFQGEKYELIIKGQSIATFYIRKEMEHCFIRNEVIYKWQIKENELIKNIIPTEENITIARTKNQVIYYNLSGNYNIVAW